MPRSVSIGTTDDEFYSTCFRIAYPHLGFDVDAVIESFSARYHATLRRIVGLMVFEGWVNTNHHFLSILSPKSEADTAEKIEKAIWDIVKALMNEGVIPSSIPYITVSWYVLHWVIVPFIRSVLEKVAYADVQPS